MPTLLWGGYAYRKGQMMMKKSALGKLSLLLLVLLVFAGTVCGTASAESAPEAAEAESIAETVAEPEPTPIPFIEPETLPGGSVWFDGKQLPHDRVSKDGVEFVRLSEVAAALDTEVKHEEGSDLFVLIWRKSAVELSAGKDTAVYLEKTRPLDAAPMLCDGGADLLVPVRSFCSAAEIGVYDDEELNELTCTPGTGDWELKENYNVCVMMYHQVGHATPEGNLVVDPSRLEEQFQYLNENGFTSIWFEDLWHVEDIQKPIILIFDDGWTGCYNYLYPLCEKYHIKATVALITGHLDHYASKLKTPQLEEMRESPYLSFYSHTVNHDTLDSIPRERVEPEMRESEKWLVRFFHREPVTLVYPVGGSDEYVQELTRQYYRFGVKMTHPDVRAEIAWSSYNTSDDPTLVYRYFVQRQTTIQRYAMWIEYPFATPGANNYLSPDTILERKEGEPSPAPSGRLKGSDVYARLENGIFYQRKDSFLYVPEYIDDETQILVYFGGGTSGWALPQVYVQQYLTAYKPNAVMLFFKSSEVYDIPGVCDRTLGYLEDLSRQYIIPLENVKLAGHGNGGYTALHLAGMLGIQADASVDQIVILDMMGWNYPRALLSEEEAQPILDMGTTVYHFGRKGEVFKVEGAQQFAGYGIPFVEVSCKGQGHDMIERDAMSFGVLSWMLGETDLNADWYEMQNVNF